VIELKKICFLLASFMLVFPLLSIIVNASSWYCKREKNHIQPRLGSELAYVENYDLYWCDKKHKTMDDERVIYLTFDAGYENGNVEKIVDILNEENVKGAFFVLDNFLIKNEALVKKMIESGHTVANHTFKHTDMTKITDKKEFEKQLSLLENLYEKIYGEKMAKLYRPPEGKFNEDNLKWAKELGYKTVMWSFAYDDWDNNRQMNREAAKKKILDNIHNGEVMLLHPTSKTNAEIIKDVIIELKKQGFRFGTLEELCQQ
jgi:peptidoglycan-N-acetylmuramic acid deacetylase